MIQGQKFKSDAQVRRDMEERGYWQQRSLWTKESVAPNADRVIVYIEYVPIGTRREERESHVGEYEGRVVIKMRDVRKTYINVTGTCYAESLDGLERILWRKMREYGKFILDMFGGDDADH